MVFYSVQLFARFCTWTMTEKFKSVVSVCLTAIRNKLLPTSSSFSSILRFCVCPPFWCHIFPIWLPISSQSHSPVAPQTAREAHGRARREDSRWGKRILNMKRRKKIKPKIIEEKCLLNVAYSPWKKINHKKIVISDSFKLDTLKCKYVDVFQHIFRIFNHSLFYQYFIYSFMQHIVSTNQCEIYQFLFFLFTHSQMYKNYCAYNSHTLLCIYIHSKKKERKEKLSICPSIYSFRYKCV